MHTTPSALMGIAGRSRVLVNAPAIQKGTESPKVSAKKVAADLSLGEKGIGPPPPIASYNRARGLRNARFMFKTAR